MNSEDAIEFCSRWLPAWTGNKPEGLIDFYHEDILYRDPFMRRGVQSRKRLFSYFKRLLRANPEWVWTHDEVFPTAGGFTLKWKAEIPVKGEVLEENGLDIVEIKDERIVRNEVYFDTIRLQ